MKASVEWLKQYADINVDVKTLADTLTMTGSNVEFIDSKGNDIKNVVVGKILEIENHPDADKLVVAKVDIKEEVVQIVTGAKNINVDDIIPVAKVGAELPGSIKIKKGKLRGIDSCGMMCSIGELNLSVEEYPDQIEEGIMILPKSYEKHLGENIVNVLGLREDVLDFEITPNRPDCLSIEGLGREVAASLKVEFKNPHKNLDNLNIENKKELEGLKVKIEAPDLCYRYIARIAKNIKIGPSPKWMVKRLKDHGIRSINNIVDITNYVMLEMGQPMHAFDINSIEGNQINVRRAKEQEKIYTLDGEERILNQDDLVIADKEKAVAIAGVMGGQNSGIELNTKTIVFESAVFNAGSVRKTAKKVGLRTEASSRYEKGLSAENAERAVNRAIELVELLNAGTVVEGKIDVYPTKQKLNQVPFEPERINKLLGTNISTQEMINILNSLDIKVEKNIATAPYFRQDIEIGEDLSEEVLRIYGYDKLGTTLVSGDATVGFFSKIQKVENKIHELLVNNGFSEILTYGFINEKDLDKLNIQNKSDLKQTVIKIKNPLSEDYNIMRTTTVPSMLNVIKTNLNNKNENITLYDISRIYKNTNNSIENGETPLEEKILTLGLSGNNTDFYVLKGFVENVLESTGVSKFIIEREEKNSIYHPGRTANIKVGNDIIATLGEVHPEVLENFEIHKKVYVAEVNIEKITKYSRTSKKYQAVPKFPAVERDIAIIVDENIEVGSIEQVIIKKAKKILESVKLFDIYRSKDLGTLKKSVAYNLTFRDKNKTLNDKEVMSVMDEIIAELKLKFNAELR